MKDEKGRAAPTSTGAKGPDELREQVEGTKDRLGVTAEELAGEADAKTGATDRAADLKGRAGQAGHAVQDKAGAAGRVVQEKAAVVQEKAVQAGRTVRENVPDPVRTVATTVAQYALRVPRPVLIAGAGAGALVAAGALRRRGRH
ncbi:DUF3618 domain-containing protein [Streptomyces minutiscleroticus]|uniref:Alanine-rich protein n=1 Tax=Streptomyces minutiscleroticus TaxID=68238 RepID=A0A918NLR3_9ACTN|nr:DUF3618 domain-containing protein [Streptomyces minutiscleroticus]GGX79365.1 hypothetical protein GCM10010358_37060 [Streptomyces minutiscleroticus]